VTNSLVAFLDNLAAKGNLCDKHVLQYMKWGNHVASESEKYNLRFLRAMYSGTGASGRTAQAMLDYMHTLGGTSYQLPRTIAVRTHHVLNMLMHFNLIR
jgi:hypothetical protein